MNNPESINKDFESGFGPITDKMLNAIFNLLTNQSFQEKMSDKLVSPLTIMINNKIKPYVYASLFLYLVIIALLFAIIYLLQKDKNNVYIL